MWHPQDQPILSSLHQKAKSLHQDITDFAITSGILYNFKDPNSDGFLTNYMPFSIAPCKINADDFERLKKVQVLYNKLLVRASRDRELCNKIFKDTARNDDFVKRILGLYNETFDDTERQQIECTVVRNDYLLDSTTKKWMMVQYNTIAAGLGTLSQHLQHLNHCLSQTLFKQQYQQFQKQGSIIPPSQHYSLTHESFVEGWKLYGNPQAALLIITEYKQKNIFDQRAIQLDFIKRGVKAIMTIFQGLDEKLELTEDRVLRYQGVEIGMVYYRCGFSPTHYDVQGRAWNCRRKIELSRALKMPSIGMQLINFKRAQLELCKKEVLLKYLEEEEAGLVHDISTQMYGFEEEGDQEKLVELCHSLDDYVLKPNRQGGGNNFYKEQILPVLEKATPEQRKGYVLMQRIKPSLKKTVLFKKGGDLKYIDTVSQFGLFGCITAKNGEIISNKQGGLLIRTKDASCNQGGIAAGFAVLDSVIVQQQ